MRTGRWVEKLAFEQTTTIRQFQEEILHAQNQVDHDRTWLPGRITSTDLPNLSTKFAL